MKPENEHNTDFLNQLPKKHGFGVPKNYFEDKTDGLHTIPFLEMLPKDSGYQTPKGYFDSFTVQPKPGKVIALKRWSIAVASIAALFILGFFLFQPNSPQVHFTDLQSNTVIEYLDVFEDESETFELAEYVNLNHLNHLQIDETISSETVNEYLELDSEDIELLSF